MWGQQMAKEAVGARAGDMISGRFGVLGWRTGPGLIVDAPVDEPGSSGRACQTS